ncbi:hypothetical protein [uncultured Algoriphagus sp.]|uniref:hypothetical protein n=1 Tax=uncultured Algoriphagus sp. TaxID=417365 RepID=UPI002585E893|nr:hypothetical protein [uncultured Algoriphagus sp.]
MSVYIKVNGQKLDLPLDFNVELVMECPILIQNRTPFPYTTSFDFPLTESNRKLFEHPDRVNLANRSWEYSGAVLGVGALVLYYGSLIIREISGKLSANFQAVDNLAKARQPMNELDLGRYEFGEADYEHRTEDFPGVGQPRYNYGLLFFEAHRNKHVFAAAPIRQTGSRETRSFDGTELFVNILFGQNNFFNAWAFIGGNDTRLKENIIPGELAIPTHTVMYPQIRLSELFKIVLELPDEENPFLDEELSKLVLTAHYHPNFRDDIVIKWKGILVDNDYPNASSPAEELYFNLGTFQSTVTAADVLHSAMNMFCMTLFRIQDGPTTRFQIRYNKDLINDESFQDWNARLGSRLILSREPAQNYVYGYQEFSEKKPEVDPEFVLGTIQELLDAPVDPDTLEQVYYIQTTGQLILKKQSLYWDANPELNKYSYEVKNHGLYGSVAREGFDISVALGPLQMVPSDNLQDFKNSDSPIDLFPLYQPLFSGSKDPSYKPSIMLYQGLTPNGSFGNELVDYPYLSYHNYSPTGIRMGELSLAWDGADGLIYNYHKQYKDWHERDRLRAFGSLIFTPGQIKQIDLRQKVLLRGKLWWIEKLTIPIGKDDVFLAQAELIEAPIPGDGEPSYSDGSVWQPGSSVPQPSTGTCYTITIDTLNFDSETDDFDIRIQRPGQSLLTQNYLLFDQFEDGDDTLILVCSEIAPVLIQGGEGVESVNGVSVSSGGSCSTDGDCML